jgi:hypothetical protein
MLTISRRTSGIQGASGCETGLVHFDGQANVQARLKAEAGSIVNAD